MAVMVDSSVHDLAVVLHDGLSQELFAAELDLSELRARPELSAETREIVERIETRLRSGSGQLRAALLGALPPPSAAAGATLTADIEELAAEFARRYGVEPRVRVLGLGGHPGAEPARVLRRVAQEGLANVGKHAAASEVSVTLRRDRLRWVIVVDDDGIGDVERARSSAEAHRSFGLSSLALQVAQLGGRFSLCVAPELGGLRLRVEVPALDSGMESIERPA